MDRREKWLSSEQRPGSASNTRENPRDAETDLPANIGWRHAVRMRFFHFFNTLWLALGLLALAGQALFPQTRALLQIVSAWVLISFLLGLLLSKLGSGAAARFFLPLFAGLLPWLVMWVNFPQFSFDAPEPVALYTVLFALLGLFILLSGALAGRRAAMAAALLNSILLVAMSRWTGGFAAVTISLVLLWMLLALVAWLYEGALLEAEHRIQKMIANASPPPEETVETAQNPPDPIDDFPLEGWEQALSFEDRETRVHAVQVTQLAVRLAEQLGVTEPQLTAIRRGSLLHDIGKAAVPQNILHKPGPLNLEEWEIVRRHPEAAREMLENHPDLRDSLDIPYCHHERWDGTGYPRGLRGDEIPLAARIFAVVDVWNALRTDQPYRAAWSEDAVLVYIRQQSGSQFDPHIAEVFLEMINP